MLTGNPYVKENAPRPGRLLVFVGWGQVETSDPSCQLNVDMFWRQMEWIQPDVYVADGRDNLTIICNDRSLFDTVEARLAESLGSDFRA